LITWFKENKDICNKCKSFNEGIKLYNKNIQDYNLVYKNYLLFYIESFNPIKNIIRNVLKYLANKSKEIYDHVYYYVQDKYTLDTEKEEIILPFPSKIRYFTTNTIGGYDDCFDFLNSLKTSVCLTTKIENIKNLFGKINIS
jgi:hypothetical protein